MEGAKSFVSFAIQNSGEYETIVCPCKQCRLNKRLRPQQVYDHLTGGTGILPGYTEWVLHGENVDVSTIQGSSSTRPTTDSPPMHDESRTMHAMLADIFGMHEVRGNDNISQIELQSDVADVVDEVVDDENAKKFYSLLKEAEKPLHEKTKHSKLGAILHFYHLKCIGGISNKIFTSQLEFLNQLLPADGEAMPTNAYEAKRFLKDLGLGYEKIPACINNCMLFWKEDAILDSCKFCGKSKWKDEIMDEDEDGQYRNHKKRPVKVLRWFPLIPRLQRLFMSQHTASHMRWHADGRTKDGVLRHPADGEAWKSFDEIHPDFALDPRNVRLGLAADGFNPFGIMSSSHSTWPVMLVPYNLPPWLCMKQQSFILSLLIPGPSSPGMDISVYLQPLISELQELWNVGVKTFDISMRKSFMLRAALMWTINDFPAYADLSAYSTRGKEMCPYCMQNTRSMWLTHGGKYCYMGHRRWLPSNHQWRMNKSAFDGTTELDGPPVVPTGDDILRQLESQNPDNDGLPHKKSVFFELPYWKDNLIRHNLDVMHIEKNVLDNIIGTLLDMKGKTKDNLKARKDLCKMGLRPELHPIIKANGRTYMPAACHTMSNVDKSNFLKVLKNVRVPDGYASNVSRCVKVKERTIVGLKSHDNHIIMQQLLPIALRGSLPNRVVKPLIELSAFFRGICSKTLTLEDLNRLENDIPIILCKLERIFPPGFFTSMVHLVIHLVRECRLGGPVQYRYMYPWERYP
jgi:hypothetical protein